MSGPTTIVLNTAKPYEQLGENAHIVLGILREDGWQVDRIESNQQLLLCAVPYLTKHEEQLQAIRIQAVTAAYEARIKAADEARNARQLDALRQLRRSAIALSLLPFLYGGYGILLQKQDAFLTFFGGVVLLNSALGFLYQERRYV